jgi:hypothetical protein
MPVISARDAALFLVYLLGLALSSVHLYRNPVYAMDAVQYMGNALLMEDTDIVKVHDRVYAELRRSVPAGALRGLLGEEPTSPADQNRSRQERARNPEIFAEFLPFFAIRPLYNQSLWLLSKSGLGLLRSTILLSVASYFAIGVILLVWIKPYTGMAFGVAIAFLLMISPPLTEIGRDLTSDGLSTLVAFAALFLIFEKQRLAPGLALLLASIFFRTDFVVLAGPVLLVCWWEKRLDFLQAGLLLAFALASVLAINHFAGDYGIKMLYYRNFVGVPTTPGEMNIQFSFRDYLSAFRSGITLAVNSFFLPFLLLGIVGLVSTRLRALFGVTLGYVILHFLVLPNWQERWVAIFYLCSGICAAATVGSAIASSGKAPERLQP